MRTVTESYELIQVLPRERPWLRRIVRLAVEVMVVGFALVSMISVWALVGGQS